MIKWTWYLLSIALAMAMVAGCSSSISQQPAQKAAESAAAFYKDKTVELVVPYQPGGGYDTWGRLLAPTLGKILNATVIVKNEPAAGGKAALNRLQKQNDGLSLIFLAPRAGATSQIYNMEGVSYDLSQFNWLGRTTTELYPLAVNNKTGIKKAADLQGRKELKFASDTTTSGKAIRPIVAGYALGFEVKIVAGYKGSADELLALQRGEVDGISTTYPVLRPYFKNGDLIPLFIMEHERLKAEPDIPTIYEVKKLPDKEKHIVDLAIAFDLVGKPIATTPGVPKERVDFLEAAVKKALEDPDVIAKVKTLGEEIDYYPAKQTGEIIRTLLAMNAEDKTFFGKLLGVEGY